MEADDKFISSLLPFIAKESKDWESISSVVELKGTALKESL